MMKIKKDKNSPETKLKPKAAKKDSQKTDWQKGLLITVFACFLILLLGCLYLLLRPIPQGIKEAIDSDVPSTDIRFNEETLRRLEERQSPPQAEDPKTGKNPFSSF